MSDTMRAIFFLAAVIIAVIRHVVPMPIESKVMLVVCSISLLLAGILG